jgi:hypothetical protein
VKRIRLNVSKFDRLLLYYYSPAKLVAARRLQSSEVELSRCSMFAGADFVVAAVSLTADSPYDVEDAIAAVAKLAPEFVLPLVHCCQKRPSTIGVCEPLDVPNLGIVRAEVVVSVVCEKWALQS